MDKEKIKKEIFKKVKDYYKAAFKKGKFVAGETYVSHAARVFDEKEILLLAESALDFWLTEGRFVKKFEKEFCRFLNIPFTILTNSGSSANLLALMSLTSPKLGERRLKPGDEVIAVAAAFPTTVNPIIQASCVPVFVDIDFTTLNIDSSKIEKAITKKTKAIFLAHTLGNPFDLNKIIKIAKKNNLFIIEDACDALGSSYKGRFVGTFGDIGTFSFYPAHHITMGEGGALVTKDPKLKMIIRSFRDWGRDCWCDTGCDNTCKKRFEWKLGKLPYGFDHKFIYSHLGYNLKLTEMQAAVGLAQLDKLPEFIRIRKNNFQLLYNGLEKYKKYFIFLKSLPESDPSWFGFPITLKRGIGFSRKEIVDYLEKNKIGIRMLFSGDITKQPYFENINYRISGSLENTDYVMENTFWIGVYPGITKEMADYIIKKFDEFLKNKNA